MAADQPVLGQREARRPANPLPSEGASAPWAASDRPRPSDATEAGVRLHAALADVEAIPRTLQAHDDEIRAALIVLRQAIRAQDDFLHAVAHDLRNPLAAIRGQVQLLQRRAGRFDLPSIEAERLVGPLVAIDGAVSRTAELIDRLLDASWRLGDLDDSD